MSYVMVLRLKVNGRNATNGFPMIGVPSRGTKSVKAASNLQGEIAGNRKRFFLIKVVLGFEFWLRRSSFRQRALPLLWHCTLYKKTTRRTKMSNVWSIYYVSVEQVLIIFHASRLPYISSKTDWLRRQDWSRFCIYRLRWFFLFKMAWEVFIQLLGFMPKFKNLFIHFPFKPVGGILACSGFDLYVNRSNLFK